MQGLANSRESPPNSKKPPGKKKINNLSHPYTDAVHSNTGPVEHHRVKVKGNPPKTEKNKIQQWFGMRDSEHRGKWEKPAYVGNRPSDQMGKSRVRLRRKHRNPQKIVCYLGWEGWERLAGEVERKGIVQDMGKGKTRKNKSQDKPEGHKRSEFLFRFDIRGGGMSC